MFGEGAKKSSVYKKERNFLHCKSQQKELT